MIKRVPIVATIVVIVAVVLMIWLGVWQLRIRLPQKEAYLHQLAANPLKPAIAYPAFSNDQLLFRRASGMCVQPVYTRLVGAGAAGFREIVDCRTGVEGPGMTVQLGTTHDPRVKVDWRGGIVSGYLSHVPDTRSLLSQLWDRTPARLMIVVDTPPPGLARNSAPDLAEISNNHFAYAIQWFAFAAIALIIYVLALRRRLREPAK